MMFGQTLYGTVLVDNKTIVKQCFSKQMDCTLKIIPISDFLDKSVFRAVSCHRRVTHYKPEVQWW